MFSDLYNHSFRHLLTELHDRITREQKTFLVTINPVIYMQGKKDPHYNEIVHHADYITPDGIGIVKACQLLRMPVKERITGFDLMNELLHLGNQHGWKVYLLGSDSSIVSKTSETIIDQYPDLVMAGYHHGYFSNDDQIIDEIQESQPDLIFVAMGCPRQEKWIHDHLGKFEKGVFIGVGGSFDVMAGEDKRAPQQWIDMNIEWLYRIVKKPRRILLIPTLILYVVEVVKELAAMNSVVAKRKVVQKKG
ncbi:N-acetylglucosaminyldiphosphoundecaprenol N-acetyl-beta-D-mannosaminyltransferase [Neobacillus niacini]|uniref:WecB/TagA/CpsF family glycosyltransferase n=1 Tax=Neobacillus niacini TaxID=86668 RepID=UPI002864FA33|nr:WecB/TagA/CpsF family glycosyltransferase [Neobacillus niacini]MDR7079598.1 N-acetylglucosaminyldiphosphoundecaprenol N-acetyl-beta-D-mannosaminyltransferase [Neobacillus niacini]